MKLLNNNLFYFKKNAIIYSNIPKFIGGFYESYFSLWT